MNVDDALQMCSAPSSDFTGGEWCFAANTLAEEVERLRAQLHAANRVTAALDDTDPWDAIRQAIYMGDRGQECVCSERGGKCYMHAQQERAESAMDVLQERAEAAEAECVRLREQQKPSYRERRLTEKWEAAEARCARLEKERDEYRIEADHGHDDYEDAENVIRQIAETRPNQLFDPWARDLCREFLDRPRRSRQTIQAIRERCARLQHALRGVGNAYGCFAGCTGALPGAPEDGSGHTPACREAREALAGPDTPADRYEVWDGRKVYDYETGAYLGRAVGEPYSDGVEGLIALRQDEEGLTVKSHAPCAFVVLDAPPQEEVS